MGHFFLKPPFVYIPGVSEGGGGTRGGGGGSGGIIGPAAAFGTIEPFGLPVIEYQTTNPIITIATIIKKRVIIIKIFDRSTLNGALNSFSFFFFFLSS